MTALAAVITAIGGVIAVLLQAGIIGGAQLAAPPPIPTQAKVGTPPTTSTSAGNVPEEKPWRDVEAVITAKDGTVTKMRAETVRFCISAGTGINLNDSQDIAFEKISRIDVLRSDVALSPGGKAALRVGLASGSTLEGTITSGCDFFGQTEVGRYSLYPDRLLTIEFLR
ncbi:MAG TPA: hypothetical protein VFN75_11645 [Pseudonocardiaceae bacterium]|nr:hypothetical protein [Pseudonocardiaceae bacterium]